MNIMKSTLKRTMSRKLAILIAATSILTTASFPSFAEYQSDKEVNSRFKHFERGEHSRAKSERRTQNIANALDLTESQIQLFKLSHPTPKESRKEINELRKQLRDLTQSSDYSERQANKIAQQIAEITQSHIVARSNAQNAFYISLSEEQLATLNAMREKMKGKKNRHG